MQAPPLIDSHVPPGWMRAIPPPALVVQ